MFIKVKVFPESKKEEIILKKENVFEIHIKEKAEQGRANERMLEILSKYLNVSLEKMRIMKGAKQRSKIIEIK